MDLDKVIRSRKSVREFSRKKPDWRAIVDSVNAARFAPAAGNNFEMKFIVLKNPDKINNVAKSCHQLFVAEAYYVIVAVSDPSRLINEFGEEAGQVYCRQQAGAAIQNILLKAQELGLSTCWVGLFEEHEVKVELKIPDKMQVEAVIPIGYEMKKSKPKNKIPLENVIRFDDFKTKKINDTNKNES
ncbi:MAG TPA: nitroreductase family protein [Candidatus Pacearchaeota archaeon]|nr:nitroreductase family protein [Candidatus Pacearchaeota archaeon]